MRNYPYLDHDGPIAFAHRGGAAGGVENSLAAFQRAYDLGYRYFETDVHATSDGAVLAFHDHTLDRLTDSRGPVASQPWKIVSQARIGGREPIPLLADLLGSFPDTRVNIDVKDSWAIRPLVDVISHTNSIERVCVASFSGRRIAVVRARFGPLLATSFAPTNVLALRFLHRLGALRRFLPPDVPCVQVPERVRGVRVVTPQFVEAAHAQGLVVHVWTIDDAKSMESLLDLGVDGIMTDELPVLRTVMATRGLWPDGSFEPTATS